jgi:hypothetical protein
MVTMASLLSELLVLPMIKYVMAPLEVDPEPEFVLNVEVG